MKLAAQSPPILLALGLTMPSSAQTIPPGTFKHIIIVVQENRTPDNLFGAAPAQARCGVEDPFETGVDIENGGYAFVPQPSGPPQLQLICNTPLPLSSWDANLQTPKIIDPDHRYHGWGLDFDSGHLDGFCHEYSSYAVYGSTCPSYSYVPKADVQPYFDIATRYGFANYAFQTNEGPSFPAHQFLFTGTSAPVAPHDSSNYFLDFLAENPPGKIGFSDSGCHYNGSQGYPSWVQPNGASENDKNLSECYPHDSLVTDAADCSNGTNGDYCDRRVATWAYYTPTPGIIWDAPEGIPEVCYGQNATYSNNACGSGPSGNSKEWADHVLLPDQNGYSDAPIFDDLFNCKLKEISWVIPDFQWSDHPQDNWKTDQGTVYGPSWVGDIINAVGNGMTGSTCNPPSTPSRYWSQEPTLVIVVWDDWGGWFDHVTPFAALQQNPHQGYTQCDPNSQWGCGYTYGFRVPLLVVSPWTGTKNLDGTYSGYVSGACGPGLPSCPNFGPNNLYIHDFGSILAFTEYNFSMSQIYPNTTYYADHNAPDWGQQRTNIPLSDFFSLPVSQPGPFTPISTPWPFTCFQHFGTCTGTTYTSAGPDDDNEADQ